MGHLLGHLLGHCNLNQEDIKMNWKNININENNIKYASVRNSERYKIRIYYYEKLKKDEENDK